LISYSQLTRYPCPALTLSRRESIVAEAGAIAAMAGTRAPLPRSVMITAVVALGPTS
jgi:hypothetical protein